jgi:hypothetical protein
MIRRRSKAEPALPLDPGTMVVCVESFRRQPVARMTEKGSWLRLDDPQVQARLECFAVRLSEVLGRLRYEDEPPAA